MLLFSWQKCVYIIHGATFYIHMITYHDQSVCSFTYIRSYSFISFLFFCKKCRYLYVIAVGIEFRWSTRSDGGMWDFIWFDKMILYVSMERWGIVAIFWSIFAGVHCWILLCCICIATCKAANKFANFNIVESRCLKFAILI